MWTVAAACGGKPEPPAPALEVSGPSPYDTATPVVVAAAEAGRTLRAALGAAPAGRLVADRTAVMAAWVAVDAAATLSALWRDRLAVPAPATALAVSAQLTDDVARLLDAGAASIRARAAAIYRDARDLALVLVARGLRGDPVVPVVTSAGCELRSSDVVGDLGGVATTELLVSASRPGLPWVALRPSELVSRVDRTRLVRPDWLLAPPTVTHLVSESVGRASHGDGPDRERRTREAFARAVQAGFESPTAIALAETTEVSGAVLVQLEAAAKNQLETIAAAPSGAPRDFLQVGALIDGQRTGARARSFALTHGRPIGIVRDLEARHAVADRSLADAQKELQACVLTLDASPAREASLVGLLMIDAYSSAWLGQAGRSCEHDAECAAPAGTAAQAAARCIAVADIDDRSVKMCLGAGWACRKSDDCGPGTECDPGLDQCVDRVGYRCGGAQRCRSIETCAAGTRRCELDPPAIGQRCERNEVSGQLLQGECRKGIWREVGDGAHACVVNAPQAEICDGKDNDCNGQIDDATPACP